MSVRKSQDFRIFCNMKVDFGQNGLTLIAVIFTVNNKMKTSSLTFELQKYIGIITALSSKRTKYLCILIVF